jgi:hypothetical protein
LRVRVEDTVENYGCGKIEFSQVTAGLNKSVVTDTFSRESGKVIYWHREPAQCVANYISGEIDDDLRKEGQMEIVPYTTTQNYRNKLGMTLLIGAYHGKGAWRSLIKIFFKRRSISTCISQKMQT